MKFKNTFDTPIYIEGKANGSTITFTVYGKKKDPKRTVEFLSETTQVKESSCRTVLCEKADRILDRACDQM